MHQARQMDSLHVVRKSLNWSISCFGHTLACSTLHSVGINSGDENYRLQYFNNEQWRHNTESADFPPNQAALSFKTSIIITHLC